MNGEISWLEHPTATCNAMDLTPMEELRIFIFSVFHTCVHHINEWFTYMTQPNINVFLSFFI